MSFDSWLGVGLLATALIVLVIATAAETGIVFVNRARVRAFARKGLPQATSLSEYIRERRALLSAIAIARNAAVVLGLAVGTFLVLRETGETWAALGATMAIALLALVLLEAVPRLLVARHPERWGLRLLPAMRAFWLLFGLPARLLNLTISAVLRHRDYGEASFESRRRRGVAKTGRAARRQRAP